MFHLHIQYLCDANGTQTAVLLPINEWDSLLKEYQLLKEKKPIHLAHTSTYPCQYDDLIDSISRETVITISTFSYQKEENEEAETGIFPSEDGIIDIVIDAEMLTEQIVKKQLHILSKLTGNNYILLT